MRKKYIYIPFFTLAAGAFFLGNSNGPGFDYTGAPGANGNCTACHSDNSNLNATMSILVVEKGQTTPVTSYEAGKVYTVAIAVTGGSSAKRGFEATVLTSSNNKVGNLSGASAGVTLYNANNRNIAGHNTPSATGLWSFDWTAPSASAGTVNIWAAGNATNSNNNFTGDQVLTTSFSLTASTAAVTEPAVAQIGIYPNPATNVLNLPAGYTSAGIFDMNGKKVLQATGSHIDISALNPGTYVIQASNNKTAFSERFVKL